MNYCSFLVCRPAVGGVAVVWVEFDPMVVNRSPRMHICGPRADGVGESHDAVLVLGS